MNNIALCPIENVATSSFYKRAGLLSVCISIIICIILLYAAPTRDTHFDNDSMGYDRISYNFYHTGILEDPLTPGNAPIQPVGYAWFLGVLYHIFGYNFTVVIITQLLLHLLTLVLIMRCGRLLFGQLVGALSGLLYAANIGAATYIQFVLAETLLVFMIMLFIERFLVFWQTNSLWILAQACLILGVSTLIKPIALVYPPIIVLMILIGKRNTQLPLLLAILLSTSCFYTPVLGYMGRNFFTYGTFTFAPMNSLNMYQCYLSKVIARDRGTTPALIANTTLAFTGKNSFDESGWAAQKNLFNHYLLHRPFLCIYVWLENVIKTAVGLFSTQLKMLFDSTLRGGNHSFFAQEGSFGQKAVGYIVGGTSSLSLKVIACLETAWSIIRWIIVACALFALYKKRCYFALTFLCSFSFLCAFATDIDGCCRYRLTFEPLLVIVTALGCTLIYQSLKKSFVEKEAIKRSTS